MSTIPGLQSIRTLEVPLVGRPAVVAQLLDADGNAFAVTNQFSVKVEVFKNADDAAPLFTKTTGAGQITILNATGYIYLPLADADVVLLDVGKLATVHATVLYASDGTTIKLVNTFCMISLNQLVAWSQPTEVVMSLSTAFKNTQILLGEAGGAGYLDGISTVVQPVGCMVEFTITGDINTPPATWELEVWDGAQDNLAGAWRKPTDFNAATNRKIWRKTS